MITSCRLDGGNRTVSLFVSTTHPRLKAPDDSSHEGRYKYFRHLVKMEIDRNLLPFFFALDAKTRAGGITEMYPCRVDGFLDSDGRESFVRCAPEGFARTETLKTSGNNVAILDVSVVSLSVSGDSATLQFENNGRVFNSFVSKEASPDAYRVLSEGRLSKGDRLSLSGPLNSCMFSDGRQSFRMAVLLPKEVTRLKLSLDRGVRNEGPSIG